MCICLGYGEFDLIRHMKRGIILRWGNLHWRHMLDGCQSLRLQEYQKETTFHLGRNYNESLIYSPAYFMDAHNSSHYYLPTNRDFVRVTLDAQSKARRVIQSATTLENI